MKIYVVEEGDNPSSSFFVSAAIKASGMAVQNFCFRELPSECDGAIVVFVRYIPETWRKWVAAHRSELSGVIFFMDDDVLDLGATAGMPWRYRWKLWRLAGSQIDWLHHQEAELWVSSRFLQQKYANWPAKLVLPSLPAASGTDGLTRLFYHGSASHNAEIRWLRPVVQAVMEADSRIRFELVGDSRVHRTWKCMRGVTVVHPMKWPAYRSFSALQGRDIGLAPLLDAPFNHARSYTKFFDITRSGAVGVYSHHPAFTDVIEHNVHGLVVENTTNDWVEAILSLVENEGLRANLLTAAKKRVVDLSAEAQKGYQGLI